MLGSDNIMISMMNALYTTLTDGQEEFIEANEHERFITWCLPGIPISEDELRFLERGLVGQGKTPEEKAADTAVLVGQASRFARLVDFIPDVTGIFNEQQQLVAFHRNESNLSRIYELVLQQSQVAATELTEQEKATIERFRNLLYPEQEVVTDIVTNKIEKMRVEGPIMKLYKEGFANWDKAFLARSRRVLQD